jgi:CubicO group peptidase (beta-lactamase class C family)
MPPRASIIPLLLVTACSARPAQTPALPTPPLLQTPATAPAPAAAPLTQRFAATSWPVPSLDPQRKEKILALVPRIDAHYSEQAASKHYPGLAVGIVVDGQLVWSKGYGVRDVASKQPVDADTLFRLASVTKSFTAIAVLQLRDAGKLSLDDPAEKYLPEMAGLIYPSRDSARITIRQLLTHTAGLPRGQPVPMDDKHAPTEEEILKSLQGMELDAPPNTRHSYSNLGFMLAGMIVARVSGTPYTDYLTSHVLVPLGMTSTGFDPPADRLASGYVLHGGEIEHPPMIKQGATAPAGGLFSSLRDLARYASFQLSAWPPRNDADDGPLRRSSVREAQRMSTWDSLGVAPRVPGKPMDAVASGYGFGWVFDDTCALDSVVWHNGALSDGYRSLVMLLPDRGVAMVALTNLFEPQSTFEDAMRDAFVILRDGGALEKPKWPVTQELLAVRDRFMSLRDTWSDSVAKGIFRDDVGDYLAQVKQGFVDDKRVFGGCHIVATASDGPRRIHWDLACDRGGQGWDIALDPQGRIAWLSPEDRLPPDARLAKAAAQIAGLVGRWDDKVYDARVGPPADRTALKALFAAAGAEHGSCKVDRAGEHGDPTHHGFSLACARGGPLELRAVLDDKSGKVTQVDLQQPDNGNRCP